MNHHDAIGQPQLIEGENLRMRANESGCAIDPRSDAIPWLRSCATVGSPAPGGQ
jgi:hypothetical protein